MKERPINLKDWEVLGILEGWKTHIWRVVKPLLGPEASWHKWEGESWKANGLIADIPREWRSKILYCPYGRPGGRLWVRHTWFDLKPPTTNPANYQVWDELTCTVRWKTGECVFDASPCMDEGDGWKKHHSVHMPRWASRITLEITGVRIEGVRGPREMDVCWMWEIDLKRLVGGNLNDA